MKKKIIGMFIGAMIVIVGITMFKIAEDNKEPQWSKVEGKVEYKDLYQLDLNYFENMEYAGSDDPIYVMKNISYSIDFEEGTIEKETDYDSRYYEDIEETYEVSPDKMMELGEYIINYNNDLFSKKYDYDIDPTATYCTTLDLFEYNCSINDKHNRTKEYKTYGVKEFGYPEGWYDLIAKIESVL